MFGLLIWTTWLLGVVSGQNQRPPCPAFSNGTITIASYQLYPENVDFDGHSCLLWYYVDDITDIGALYNASVVVYDPYAASVVSTLELPSVTRTKPSHIGAAWDPYSTERDQKHTDDITILVDATPAHETAGRDVSGDNYIMRYDAAGGGVRWFTNLTATTRGRYGGLQDIEHDSRSNAYVLGTYPATLLRVSYDGQTVSEWYVPGSNGTTIDHTVKGYTGLAADGDTLLVSDARNNSPGGGAIYRFNMTAPKGKPMLVPIVPSSPHGGNRAIVRPMDAIYLPAKYNNSVLLIAEHSAGVSVLRSRMKGKNKWRSADFLGRIPNPPDVAASGALVTAAVEIQGSVFLVEEWFTDPLVPGTSAGNRTLFPLVDITAQLDALVNSH
ncbi:hypothetical protein HD806DRAFT_522282 [Xylariaceae sp. AK1471]|nr:hypothetical protein HD806DRAFT_522282 [Xylariaceae sp. AK1471]